MEYNQIKPGIFLSRPNRFIAMVMIDGREEQVHVPNTGRCAELFIPGTAVILSLSANPLRKTRFSLVAVAKGSRWINIDSQVPNAVVAEALQAGMIADFASASLIKREVTYGQSRFDLYLETPAGSGFIEVKGVTLEKEGLALFPDAPTLRGTKHVDELVSAVSAGYFACLFFLVQMKGIQCFSPNKVMDPLFSQAVNRAAQSGVQILAFDSQVEERGIILGDQLPVVL